MMALYLTVLSSPVPQSWTEFRLDGTRAVLGRDESCDCRITDPEMFISRRHCLIEPAGAGWTVTDTSSGGLFLDQAPDPLGPGASAALRDGMRLRLGDVVLGVRMGEVAAPVGDGGSISAQADPLTSDPFFQTEISAPPPAARPPELPPLFQNVPEAAPRREITPPPQDFQDVFSLDGQLSHDPPPRDPPHDRPEAGAAAQEAGGAWDWGPAPPSEADFPRGESARPQPSAAPGPRSDAAAAFLRGAGLEASGFDTPDFEALGRCYRMLTEGVVALLRSRDEEKSSLCVARTVLGAEQVNPLKFLAMPEERLAALIAPRGPGYLDPEAAIAQAFRDLADHRMRSWQGLQAALRRMVDHFSPEAVEAELADAGMLRALLAGGRSALLWDAYAERWAEIARAAEDRFLGEIGADFRDAYETPRQTGQREP